MILRHRTNSADWPFSTLVLINAGTAGIITSALGEAFIKIMSQIYKGEMDESIFTSRKGKRVIAGMFRDEIDRRSRGKKGSRR